MKNLKVNQVVTLRGLGQTQVLSINELDIKCSIQLNSGIQLTHINKPSFRKLMEN